MNPNLMTSVLIKRETGNRDENTEGRMPGDNRGRDWSDVAARQGTDGDHQKLEATRGNKFLPKAFRGSAALPAPSFLHFQPLVSRTVRGGPLCVVWVPVVATLGPDPGRRKELRSLFLPIPPPGCSVPFQRDPNHYATQNTHPAKGIYSGALCKQTSLKDITLPFRNLWVVENKIDCGPLEQATPRCASGVCGLF